MNVIDVSLPRTNGVIYSVSIVRAALSVGSIVAGIEEDRRGVEVIREMAYLLSGQYLRRGVSVGVKFQQLSTSGFRIYSSLITHDQPMIKL